MSSFSFNLGSAVQSLELFLWDPAVHNLHLSNLLFIFFCNVFPVSSSHGEIQPNHCFHIGSLLSCIEDVVIFALSNFLDQWKAYVNFASKPIWRLKYIVNGKIYVFLIYGKTFGLYTGMYIEDTVNLYMILARVQWSINYLLSKSTLTFSKVDL